MSLTVTPVTAGGAHQALAEAVREAKDGDPLRPVTVLVPTNAAGVTARRTLGRLMGVAAVDLITLYRLAERIAGPSLRSEQRLPVSTAVVDLAVRAVLRDTTTAFDAVAEHPSTVVALRDLHRELRLAGPDAVDRLDRSSPRGSDVAEVSRRTAARLAGGWYDEGDLLVHAIAAVRAGADPGPLERIIVFLPQSLGPLELELISALGERGTVRVLLGLTGDAHADRDLVEAAGALTPAPVTCPPCPPRATAEIVSVTDADEEVRHAVRAVVDAARAGMPLARMAVLWPSDRPYARLVEHHFDLAGIAWNGRPGTRVSERVVPRFLLDLLDVDRRGLRRRDLFDLLADLPVRDGGGRPAPVAAWERASREAGVVKHDQWTPRLRSWAAWQRRRAAERHEEEAEPRDQPVASPAADAAEALAEFVAELRRQLGPPGATRPWSEWADWAIEQIELRLGSATLQRLGEAELQAWEHTTRVLDRLRHLDAIGHPATRSEFRSVFAAEFDVAPGRLGRIGSGVTIGSLSGAAGLVADLVIVVGAADGLMPAPPAVDPLIGEGDRRAAGLATSESVIDRAHRQFLGVLDSAQRVVVLSPRGDLRTTTARQPSRWLNALAAAPTEVVASHASGLLSTRFPAHACEHRLRARSAGVLATGPVSLAATDDAVLARALRLRTARRSDRLTEYDGDLTGVGVPRFERPVSPTQLQTWTACPHAYFVQYLLGVRVLEEPADEIAITPADRGNALHEVLDAFHREVIDGVLPQPGTQGWDEIHRARLAELLCDTADRYERSGRTGRAAYWAVDGARLATELALWFEHDSRTSASRAARVVASEMRFGREGDVTLALPDGRRLAVHGTIDRVDRTPTGLVVTDHKSGSAVSYRAIHRDDPTAGRTRFQLPAYAAAAMQLFGDGDDVPVHAEYAFFQRGKFQRIGYTFDPPVWARVAADLEHVVFGIEAGWFPPTPIKPQFQFRVDCHYCQPDALGTAERYHEWERKQHDPRLARWFGADQADATTTADTSTDAATESPGGAPGGQA